MVIMGIISASLAPVFIIAFYVYFRDRYEKEPVRMLLKAMAAGMVIVAPVIVVEGFINRIMPPMGHFAEAAYQAFLVAAGPEELFKYLALFVVVWKSPEFNEQFDGIVYAVFVSLGFAAVENVMYVVQGGYHTAAVRALTAVPAHAIFGVTMGYYFGVARRYKELRKDYLFRSVSIPFLLHGVYDFILMAGVDWMLFLFIPFLFFLYRAGARKMKRLSDISIFRTSDPDQDLN
jgi:RsiW-degrading membrane proteinase PrsW (M82 family)